MTFARPLLLLCLAALPLLFWLSRRRRRRRPLAVTSLMIWERLNLTPNAPREARRQADRLLGLRLAAAGLIAVAMAGPRLGGAEGAPVLHVVRDVSPSMTAARADEAISRLRAEADADLVVHESDGLDALPAVLAEAGGGDVVFVTDTRPEAPFPEGRVRLLLCGVAVANAGFSAAWIEEGRYGVVVTNFAEAAREVTVRLPDRSESVALAPGEARRFEGPAPAGASLEFRLAPGDGFAFDDRITVTLAPPAPLPLAWRGPDEPATRLALEVAGIVFGDDGREVVYSEAPDGRTAIWIAAGMPGRRTGAAAGADSVSPDVVPDPRTPLGPAARLEPGGRAILVDGDGPLAQLRAGRIEVALDPGDPASGWSRDPSFPIFWAEVARRLGARVEAAAVVTPALDPSESATRPESASLDLSGLRPSRPVRSEPLAPAAWLYGLAALLLVVHVRLESQASFRPIQAS